MYNDKSRKDVVLKNNFPFRSRITKINGTLIGNADLDIVMSMYKLLEHSGKYSMTTETLCNYALEGKSC